MYDWNQRVCTLNMFISQIQLGQRPDTNVNTSMVQEVFKKTKSVVKSLTKDIEPEVLTSIVLRSTLVSCNI